jgi:hypothetical protein
MISVSTDLQNAYNTALVGLPNYGNFLGPQTALKFTYSMIDATNVLLDLTGRRMCDYDSSTDRKPILEMLDQALSLLDLAWRHLNRSWESYSHIIMATSVRAD